MMEKCAGQGKRTLLQIICLQVLNAMHTTHVRTRRLIKCKGVTLNAKNAGVVTKDTEYDW